MEFEILEGVFVVLISATVISLVFEVAVTSIFSWRVYKKYLGSKGAKMPIITVLAFVVFWGYDLDIIYALLTAMGAEGDIVKGPGGQALTALLIAGGSKAIHDVLNKMKWLGREVKDLPKLSETTREEKEK